MAKLHPPVLWAEDKKRIFLTVELSNIKKNTVQLEPTSLEFEAVGGSDGKEYEFKLNFNGEVIVKDSKYGVLPNKRNLDMVLVKKEEGSWSKVQKEAKKPHWLKTDFSRFKDSDDEEETADPEGGDFSNMMNQLGSFEPPGEMPGDMPEEDDDDDDLPDLENS